MKIKDGFILREVGGKNIVVATGAVSAEFNGMVRLNNAGSFLWKKLSKGADKEDLLQAVLEKYDIDEETAKADVEKFLKVCEENHFIEE